MFLQGIRAYSLPIPLNMPTGSVLTAHAESRSHVLCTWKSCGDPVRPR